MELSTERNLRSDGNLKSDRKFRSDCNSILLAQLYEYCSENARQKFSLSVLLAVFASAANLQICRKFIHYFRRVVTTYDVTGDC